MTPIESTWFVTRIRQMIALGHGARHTCHVSYEQAKPEGTYVLPEGPQRMCVYCTSLPAPFDCDFATSLQRCEEDHRFQLGERHLRE